MTDSEPTDAKATGKQAKPSGHATNLPASDVPAEGERLADDDARLDEAGIESMDASDPPAHSAPSAGAPFPRKGTR